MNKSLLRIGWVNMKRLNLNSIIVKAEYPKSSMVKIIFKEFYSLFGNFVKYNKNKLLGNK